MAEFCKECFVRDMLNVSEKTQYEQGVLQVITTDDTDVDYCENCGELKPVVLRVKRT